jgi:hypothetical protein
LQTPEAHFVTFTIRSVITMPNTFYIGIKAGLPNAKATSARAPSSIDGGMGGPRIGPRLFVAACPCEPGMPC